MHAAGASEKSMVVLHCCETWSLIWREEYELSVWQTGCWHYYCQRGRKQQEAGENFKCKASYLYSVLKISNSIGKDEMDGHVVHKEEKNNSKKVSSTKLKHWHQLKDIRVDCIYVAQKTKSALMNKVWTFHFRNMREIFWLAEQLLGLKEVTQKTELLCLAKLEYRNTSSRNLLCTRIYKYTTYGAANEILLITPSLFSKACRPTSGHTKPPNKSAPWLETDNWLPSSAEVKNEWS